MATVNGVTTRDGPKCGNPKCRVSTGIHEGLTFGRGKLDSFGYFSEPCRVCAEAWDADREEVKKKIVTDGLASGKFKTPKEAADYAQKQDWLNTRGWPFH